MDKLDLTTLRLSIMLISVVCALVLAIVWRINRELPGVLQWLLGVWVNTLTFLGGLFLSFGQIAEVWFIFFSNTLSLTALLLMLEGSLRFRGFSSPHRWRLVFVLVPVFALLTMSNLDAPLRRFLIHDLLSASMLVAAALVMVWRSSAEEFRVYVYSSLFSLALALTFLARSLLSWTASPEALANGLWIEMLLYIVILLYVIGWTYTLIAACYFKAHQHVLKLAREDPLTGLPNRRSIDETLHLTLVQAQRSGQGFALFLLDLDNFKAVNDSHGHALGDQLLQEVARRLQRFKRDADFVGRLGGDEFLLILHDIQDMTSEQKAMRRLRNSVAGTVSLEGRELPIEPSIGLALWPQDGDTADQLLRVADRKMYRQKQTQPASDFNSKELPAS
ncbi:MAG: GGDEF domain-containing protein [Pseudomonadales bacterium]|nr:GGDEF domain-containing protein [Pseudomonadales bacterium]